MSTGTDILQFLGGLIAQFIKNSMTIRNLEKAGMPSDTPRVTGSLTFGVGNEAELEEMRQRSDVVTFMRAQLGKKYVLGVEVAHDAESDAWDCSEAVEAAYIRAGLKMTDGAKYQYDFCLPVKSPNQGDLGFLWSDKRGMIGHVMVYTGQGTVIHAVGGRGVVEDPRGMWELHTRWRGWRRHPDFSRPIQDREGGNIA